MLTFESSRVDPDPLADLKGSLPDVIEVTELDLFWVQVRRSTQMVEWRSKVNGTVVKKCPLRKADLPQYGLAERQINFARAALELKGV